MLYKRGKGYILHRILKVLQEGYLIAGDHNTFIETDVTDDMIIGVMTRIIRNGKTITMDNPIYLLYVHLWCDYYSIRIDYHYRLEFRIRQEGTEPIITICTVTDITNHYQ